ncbi:MAG: SPOR domain-containing protein [Gammaproteobacteria bacterium]
MDHRLKQRLVGAIVLVALAVIFIPMVLQTPEPVQAPATTLPAAPGGDIHDRLAAPVPQVSPLTEPARQIMPAPAEPSPTATPTPGKTALATPTPALAPVAPETAGAEMSNAEAVPNRPTPRKAGPSAWVVQVGVFSQEQNAQALAKSLRAKAYTAFVERFAGKVPSFRVRVGPLKDRAAADALQARLKHQERLPALVKTYP